MQYMGELHVLEASDLDAYMAETGRPPIPTHWVDIDEGVSSRPNYWSRLGGRRWDGGQQSWSKIGPRRLPRLLPYEAFRL